VGEEHLAHAAGTEELKDFVIAYRLPDHARPLFL
jgi:hypothetical protein